MSDRISFLTLALAKKSGGKYQTWLGVTTTALSDGDTTNPITIDGKSVTAESGDVVQYGSDNFGWNGEVWQTLTENIKVEGKTLIFN